MTREHPIHGIQMASYLSAWRQLGQLKPQRVSQLPDSAFASVDGHQSRSVPHAVDNMTYPPMWDHATSAVYPVGKDR